MSSCTPRPFVRACGAACSAAALLSACLGADAAEDVGNADGGEYTGSPSSLNFVAAA